MKKGSLIQSSRRRGPDVWEYRWRQSCPGDKRKHRRIVIGSLDTLRDKAAALKATAALRREINRNDARLRAKPLTIAELINHYQRHSIRPNPRFQLLRVTEWYHECGTRFCLPSQPVNRWSFWKNLPIPPFVHGFDPCGTAGHPDFPTTANAFCPMAACRSSSICPAGISPTAERMERQTGTFREPSS